MMDPKGDTQHAMLPDPREPLGECRAVTTLVIQRESDWGTEPIIDSLAHVHPVGSLRGRS